MYFFAGLICPDCTIPLTPQLLTYTSCHVTNKDCSFILPFCVLSSCCQSHKFISLAYFILIYTNAPKKGFWENMSVKVLHVMEILHCIRLIVEELNPNYIYYKYGTYTVRLKEAEFVKQHFISSEPIEKATQMGGQWFSVSVWIGHCLPTCESEVHFLYQGRVGASVFWCLSTTCA